MKSFLRQAEERRRERERERERERDSPYSPPPLFFLNEGKHSVQVFMRVI